MPDTLIKINLLGNFSISNNNVTVTGDDLSRQLCSLLSFLIVNREQNISADELASILWPDEISNFSGALKNLVYRLRRVLEANNFPYAKGLVVTNKGSYKLNSNLKFWVDTDEFCENFDKAMALSSTDAKKLALVDTVKLYRGDFMAMLPPQPWSTALSSKFHDIYFKATYELLEILNVEQRYSEMLSLAKMAIYIDRFEETAHKYIMLSYYKTNMTEQALDYYKHTRELFYRERGVELSDSMRQFYNEISKSSKVANVDIMDLKEEFMESPGESQNTFYCELEVFKQIYRFNARVLSRTSTSFFMGLLSITSACHEPLDTRLREKAMDQLFSSIQCSLRRGDIFSRCSPSQYVIMLPAVNFENGIEIMERITRNFKSNYHSRKLTVTHNIQPIEPSGL
ncbi:MAG: BTAD domain-containing putative transcriptional regulator [Oscillospiraceae bacterium]